MTNTLTATRTTDTIVIPAVSAFEGMDNLTLEVLESGLMQAQKSWEIGGKNYTPRSWSASRDNLIEDGAITLVGGKAKAAIANKTMTKKDLRAWYATIVQTREAIQEELASRKEA